MSTWNTQHVCGLLVTIALFGAQGCQEHLDGISLYNATDHSIMAARVRYGNYDVNSQVMPAKAIATEGLAPKPYASFAVVDWIVVDGKSHSTRVPFADRLPTDFWGDVIFRIEQDDSVSVILSPREKNFIIAKDGKAAWRTAASTTQAATRPATEPRIDTGKE